MHGTANSTCRHGRCCFARMVSILRLTTIALSVLVFALVVSVCGEAVACSGCPSGLCSRSDGPTRRQGVVAEMLKAYDRLVQAIGFRPPLLAKLSSGDVSAARKSPLLAVKMAQLRI